MAIKVITFDLDNTLWDVDPALIRAEDAQRDWLVEHRPGAIDNYGHEDLWEFKKSVWKRHPQLLHNVSAMRRQMLLELQLAAGYPEAEARSGAEQAFSVFLNERHKVELYEQALEVLEQLAGQFSIGALTNGNADIYKPDAGEYFDFAFLAEDFSASKPAPDIFHAAMEKSGAAAHEIIHVGDNPEHDIQGALDVGMYAVWVNLKKEPWPGGPEAHQEVTDLAALPLAVDRIRKAASAT